ncbi:MAG: peptide deformylase [Actinomycetota bacterium]
MVLPIKILGNPVLRERSKEVELRDPTLKALVKNMEETLRRAEGVGLAPTQVGILKRVIIYDVGEGLKVLINPMITRESEEKVEDEEGCLSIPGAKVPVRRAERIRVEGYDLEGKKIVLEADGLLARVIQHEMDHLNGFLIIDRTTGSERRRVLEEMVGGPD